MQFPHRFDRFWTGFWHQNQGATFVTKSPPQFVGKVFFVRIGEQFVAIYKQQKGGRGQSDLSGVKKLQPMSRSADRLTPLNRILNRPVQQCRRNFLLQLRRDIANRFEQSVEVESGGG